jgi:hypothetical protein
LPHPLAPSPNRYIGEKRGIDYLERGNNIERGLRPLSLRTPLLWTGVIDIFSHPRLPASLVARPYDVRPVPPVVLVIYLTPLVPLS